MPRLLPSKTCPKCGGPLYREPCILGAVCICERCDRGDPIDTATLGSMASSSSRPGQAIGSPPAWMNLHKRQSAHGNLGIGEGLAIEAMAQSRL
jgi:hypothetical protein